MPSGTLLLLMATDAKHGHTKYILNVKSVGLRDLKNRLSESRVFGFPMADHKRPRRQTR